MALFIAVFVSLSSRLGQAQAQQRDRNIALGYLQTSLQEVKSLGPRRWVLPLQEEYKSKSTLYTVEIVEDPDLGVSDGSFSRVVATVRWRSVTGDQVVRREVWIHEHLH